MAPVIDSDVTGGTKKKVASRQTWPASTASGRNMIRSTSKPPSNAKPRTSACPSTR